MPANLRKILGRGLFTRLRVMGNRLSSCL